MALKTAAAAVAVLAAIGPLYLITKHRSLTRKVKIAYVEVGPYKHEKPANFTEAAARPDAKVFADRFEATFPTKDLPQEPLGAILDQFVKNGIGGFLHTPQGKLIKWLKRGKPGTEDVFTDEAIANSKLQVGDVLMLSWKVVRRDDRNGVLELAMLSDTPPVEGTLIFKIEVGPETTIFASETIQWDPKDPTVPTGGALPVVGFLHEITAMTMITRFMDKLTARKALKSE